MKFRILLLLLATSILLTACGEGDKMRDDDEVAAESATIPVEPAVVDTPESGANPNPSFDCAKAEGTTQRLVCSDANLAMLDREVDRIFILARVGKSLSDERRKELLAIQRGWIKGRDDCWKADDLRYCVLQNYVMRIHELRQGYAEARSEDVKGISKGPFALRCAGLDALVSVTYVQNTPATAYAEWRDRGVSLELVPAGSGARYEGSSFDGKYGLWIKDPEAMFELPGYKEALKCIDEPVG